MWYSHPSHLSTQRTNTAQVSPAESEPSSSLFPSQLRWRGIEMKANLYLYGSRLSGLKIRDRKVTDGIVHLPSA